MGDILYALRNYKQDVIVKITHEYVNMWQIYNDNISIISLQVILTFFVIHRQMYIADQTAFNRIHICIANNSKYSRSPTQLKKWSSIDVIIQCFSKKINLKDYKE